VFCQVARKFRYKSLRKATGGGEARVLVGVGLFLRLRRGRGRLVFMLGFAAKDNVLMRAITSTGDGDIQMSGASANDLSLLMTAFKNAQRFSNTTLNIILQRIRDPNVLPFIHVTLVFILRMSRHSGAMGYLQAEFPWDLLSITLNTLLATCRKSSRIEDKVFPLFNKDHARPFPEDFALRGLLWADDYFPALATSATTAVKATID